MTSYKYIEIIIDEIQQEIIKQRGKPNIGKEGCLRRLRKLQRMMEDDMVNNVKNGLIDISSEKIPECKKEVYGLTENVIRRLIYIINYSNIIENDKINLTLLIGAKETLDIAIKKQKGVIENEI